MPGEGILSIGATVDKTGVEAGLSSIQEGVQTTVQSIAVQVEETCARTRAAWNKLNADVKVSAQSVSAEALRTAEATKAQTAALADLRRASVLAKDANLDQAMTTSILAAAQTKVATAAAGVAAAKKEEAEAVASAAEEEALSQNFIVAAFQRAAMSVCESLDVVQEKLLQTAETAGIEAEGIGAGFAGLTGLLGAGIAAGFFGEYIDGLAKINVELDHLSAKTGIGITKLAGLQLIMKQAGGDFEAAATGLVRMESNTEKLANHDKDLEEAFTNLGLSLDAVRAAKPEELLQMIATAMAQETDANIRANSAIQIFGRGGQQLIPILREEGAELTANMETAGRLTGITNESALAARRWTQDVATLSAQFRAVLMPVMEHAEDVVRGVMGAFEAAAAAIVSALEAIATAIVAVYAPFYKLGVLMKDALTGNWSAIEADARSASTVFTDTWKAGFAEIAGNWKVVLHDFTYSSPLPPVAGSHEVEAPDIGEGSAGFGAPDGRANRHAGAAEGVAMPVMGPQTQSADTSALNAQMIAELQEQVKTTQNATKQEIEAYRSAAGEKMRIAQEDYADVESRTAFEVQMGRMSASQRLDALREAANTEKQIRQQQSAFIQALDMNDARKYAEDLKQEETAARQWAREMQQINQKAALEFKAEWEKAANQFNQGFIRAFNEVITHTKTASQAFAQMFNTILLDLADMVAKWLLKEAEKWAMSEAMQVLGIGKQKATQAAANLTTITGDAGVAAAGAMAYYSATDAPAAPAMAAAQFAATMAFAGAGVFDLGGIMGPGRMGINLSGADERVLSPSQTANFDKMVSRSTSSSSSAVTNHLHYEPRVDGSSPGLKRQLRNHADEILSIVREGYRAGKLA